MTSYRRTGPNAANPRTHHYDLEIPTQPWRDDYPAQGDSSRIERRRSVEGPHISPAGSSNSLDLFAHSHHHTFHNSTVNAVLGDQINNTESSGEVGLNLLCKEIAQVGVFHDSEARFPQPRCHPKTRKAVLGDISFWIKGEAEATSDGSSASSSPESEYSSLFSDIDGLEDVEEEECDEEDEDGEDEDDVEEEEEEGDEEGVGSMTSYDLQTPIHWLYGPAGVGKSAISQTLAERFEDDHLAASFFFSRSSPTRDNARYLAMTIAYCLAFQSRDPELRAAINEVVRMRPVILTSSIEVQFEELIAKPLRKLPRHNLEALPKVVIIDGLDECQGSQNQRRVLSTILDNLVEPVESDSDVQPHLVRREMKRRMDEPFVPIPLRFIIASRPEPLIRDVFNDPRYVAITNRTELGENYQTSRDIETYLRASFGKIARNHDAMKNVSLPWPSPGVIHNLVQRASGQFIYASTVLKYVGDEYSHPMEQLELVLGLPVGDPDAFFDLDTLYRQIMSSNPNKVRVQQILGAYFCFNKSQQRPSHSIILMESLLGLPSGTILPALRGMHSVLEIQHDSFTFRHKSFTDFLFDKRRSGDFFLDSSVHHEYLARRCVQIINAATLDLSSAPNIKYAMLNFAYHLKLAQVTADMIKDLKEFHFCKHSLWNAWINCKNDRSSYKGYIFLCKIFKCLLDFFNTIEKNFHTQLEHQLKIWSNSLRYGFYISGVNKSLFAHLFPEIEVLSAFILGVLDNYPWSKIPISFLTHYLGYNLHLQELAQLMTTEGIAICHPDWHSHAGHLRSWHHINTSRGHESLARSCLKKIRSGLDGRQSQYLFYHEVSWPSHLCKSPHKLDLVEDLVCTINFIIDSAQLQKAILWLQEFPEECHEAKNAIDQCRSRIAAIENTSRDQNRNI
ncbi:hypothetical protein VKT23_010440 [Stygiomarasmius scandens]|uniref:Nephrocystin 3-like N-terminal domain-containing protein n=1 Tax=Marasmiellus scandens TaxID=2682957 RepID=A0ABR1JCN2_9AGAR